MFTGGIPSTLKSFSRPGMPADAAASKPRHSTNRQPCGLWAKKQAREWEGTADERRIERS